MQRRLAAEKDALAATAEPAEGEKDLKLPPTDEEADYVLEKGKNEIVPGLPATTCLARIGRPIFKLIDAPWKVSGACLPSVLLLLTDIDRRCILSGFCLGEQPLLSATASC